MLSRFFFALVLALGILGLSAALPLLARSADAATVGSITLRGTVPASTSIAITATAPSNALDLSQSQVDLPVANVREIDNTTGGYRVTLASTNGGALKNGALGSVAYSARYGGQSIVLNSSGTIVTKSGPSNAVVNVLKALTISYTGVAPETLIAGAYSDTLTFTITAQ